MFKRHISEDVDKSIYEHLAELRQRLIIIIASITVMTCLLYTKAPVLVDFLKRPIGKFGLDFAFFSVTEAFMTRVKLAFLISIILLGPLIYSQLMGFVGVGLKKGEKRLVNLALICTLPFFTGGAIFGYTLIIPHALQFLITYGNSYMSPVLSGDKYLSFIAVFSIVTGIVFTIPVVLVFLGKLGVLSSRLLRRVRRFIILAVLLGEGLIVADFFSFLVIAVPFVLVYEISILIVVLIERKRKRVKGREAG